MNAFKDVQYFFTKVIAQIKSLNVNCGLALFRATGAGRPGWNRVVIYMLHPYGILGNAM